MGFALWFFNRVPSCSGNDIFDFIGKMKDIVECNEELGERFKETED